MSHKISVDNTRLYLIKVIGEGRIYSTYESIQKNLSLYLYQCDNCYLVKGSKAELIAADQLCLHDNHIRCALCCDAANKLEQYFDDVLGIE